MKKEYDNENDLCFVIMPFVDEYKEIYTPIIKPAAGVLF